MEKTNKNPLILTSIVLLIASFGLFGWITGHLFFAQISKYYIPIAPSTALSFLVLSIVLLLFIKYPKRKIIVFFSIVFLIILICFSSIILFDYLFKTPWDIENIFIINPEGFGDVVKGRMSPLTALLFILESGAVMLLYLGHSKIQIRTSGFFTVLSLFISSVLLIGYLYNTPFLYGGHTIPVALQTAICFWLISIALIIVIEPEYLRFSWLATNSTESRLFKSFFPLIVFLLVLNNYIVANIFIKFNNPALTFALVLIIAIPLFILITFYISRSLGRSLEKVNKELRKAKEIAEESEAKFRKLSANVPGLVFQFTRRADGSYFVPIASEGIKNIFGCSPEDVIDNFEPIARVIHPEDARRVIGEIEHSATHLTYFTCEFRVQIPDREPQWIFSRSTPEKLDDGSITWFGFNVNITERKKVEEELVKAKEKAERNEIELKKAQGITHIGSWYLDLETNEVTWTEELFKMYGFDPSLPVPPYTEHMKLFTPESWKILSTSLAETSEKGIPYELELRTVRDDNSNGWMWVRGEALYDENKKIVGLWGAAQDISERKNIETELQKAIQKAEEADRLKSAFLANMSHEIRTPMNGILGFTNLLKEPNLSGEEQQKYVEIIQKSGNRMLNTVNDIIDISKIETGQMEVSLTRFNISKELESQFQFFQPEAEKKGLNFTRSNLLKDSSNLIKTDLQKFNSILTNLIKNAIKYTDKGFIEIGCSKKDEHIQCYVKDSGIGIPKTRQEAIFNRFVQADIGDTRAFEGSGLGLAISKAYTEMIGGQLWVESEEGKGSVFYFTMPFQNSENNKTDNTIDESIKQTTLLNKKLKILVAEDDEVSFEHLTIILKDTANTIIHAQTGIEAVDLCRKNPDIDLVLMDIKMPQLGGYEATQRIRAFNKEVIIIAQTAFALTGDHEKSIEAGCNDYITKPIHKERLLEKIRTLLKTE